MPEICRFYGIIIYMYWIDHAPPHFHAQYGEYEGQFLIDNFALYKGNMPSKALALVVEWASQHKQELLENWEKSQKIEPFKKIEPLR
jgi:hypothetical protein